MAEYLIGQFIEMHMLYAPHKRLIIMLVELVTPPIGLLSVFF